MTDAVKLGLVYADILRERMGAPLKKIVLYGSQARGARIAVSMEYSAEGNRFVSDYKPTPKIIKAMLKQRMKNGEHEGHGKGEKEIKIKKYME